MANKTIPELTEVSSPVSSDVLIIHNSNLAKKIQLQNILPEVSDTSTIDLTIDKNSRIISGDVKSASITNAKLADVPALSIKGRKETDSGSAQDLTLLEVQTLLNSTDVVVDTEVRSLTSNWEDTYTTVRDTSGSWGSGGSVDTEVRSLTSNWEDTYTTVRDFSGSWDNTFNTTNSDTVNLAWDNSTRTLSADVVGSSLTTVLSSSLSASPLVAKAWVNFDGTTPGGGNADSGFSITVNSGSDIGTWSQSSASWTSNYIGQIFYILSIGGVSGATLGGVNVSTSGIQIISVSGTSATFRLLAGNATSSQTITGNGTSTGFTYITYGIRSSYNVSSVTKNGTGDYTVNFATPMADVNYSVAGMSRNNHGGSTDPNTGYGASICISRTTDPTINAVRIWNVGLVSTGAAANVVSLQDPTTIGITIFGN